MLGSEGVGERGSRLLSLVRADPRWSLGLQVIGAGPISQPPRLILGTPLRDLLHESLNIQVLQHQEGMVSTTENSAVRGTPGKTYKHMSCTKRCGFQVADVKQSLKVTMQGHT